MSLLVYFDQPEAALTSVVGGKGCNLIALSGAGFPVPPGCIVTAEAYQQFLDANSWLEAELAGFDYAHPEQLRGQCQSLRARLEQTALPTEIQTALGQALARLGPGHAYAVRSSSTFEDLAQAAFAGQHDTYLNVRGLDAVIRGVRD